MARGKIFFPIIPLPHIVGFDHTFPDAEKQVWREHNCHENYALPNKENPTLNLETRTLDQLTSML